MKIAFCNRKEWNNPLGGDGIQMLKTKEKLEQLYGLSIDVVTEPNNLNSSYDIVHIFNYATVDETKLFFEKAKSLGIKIASSSIFWEYKYAITPIVLRFNLYRNNISESFIRREVLFNKLVGFFTNRPLLISRKFKRNLKQFICDSNIILPNSQEEGELLLEKIGIKNNNQLLELKKKMTVVYNGVDVSDVEILNKKSFFLKYGIPENFVLQVSRIQYLKNQLNLLWALKDNKEIPIVFVGKIIERKYFERLSRIARLRGNVFFISEVEHEDIYSFFFYAQTHVLLSLRESPGLVSLEALSQGCPIVISDERFAPVKTYFGEHVEVVNPLNCMEIKKGVLKSCKKAKRGIDISKFSWDNVASQTYKAYLSII